MEKKEFLPGISVEEIRAKYFAKDALIEPPYRIYQLNENGHRYYYRFEENEPIFYPSVTTILSQTTPMPYGLLNWMLDEGREGAIEKRDSAAAYGTFMHGQFESLLINGHYDLDAVPEVLGEYMERENIAEKYFSEWCTRIRKDILAFVQFVRDYNVRPLAIEIGLVCESGHYAGSLDLPCIMSDKKGDFPAIVDFKSGRKGFYEDNELQLGLYRDMWNENYPDKPITRIFNFSPKDWRKSPTYNLKEQTNCASLSKLPHLLALARIEDEKRENVTTIISGDISLRGDGFSGHLETLTLAEAIKQRKNTQDLPPKTANAALFD